MHIHRSYHAYPHSGPAEIYNKKWIHVMIINNTKIIKRKGDMQVIIKLSG